ncbi:MAG TPA: protein kinase [Myxococcales bacterium]
MGQYRVIRKLASGGMAEIYLGKVVGAAGFEKPVAIKRMRPALAGEPEGIRGFLQEAKLCAQLVHPNVVQVLDYGTAGGLPYLVMELVDGPDLGRVICAARKAGAPIAADEAVYLVAAVADALGYAWGAKGAGGEPLRVVHRDVNPMNVLLSLEGHVKLIDFGVARAEGREHTQVGLIKGKLGYIAPELAAGGEPTHTSDVFLAGAMLWELLAGEPLFRSRNNPVQAIGEMLAYDDAKLPRLPSGAAEVQAVLRRALARDPAARYGQAREMAEALRAFLAKSGNPGGPEHLAARVRRLFPDWASVDISAEGRPLRDDTAARTSPTLAPRALPPPGVRGPPEGRENASAPKPAPQATRRKRLGELLVERGAITASQLQAILARQRAEGGRLGDWAIDLDLAPAHEVLVALSVQLEVPFVTDERLLAIHPPKEVIGRFPEETALRLLALPLAFRDGWVYVAMADPADLSKRDAVSFAVGQRFRAVLGTESGIREAITRAYAAPESEPQWRKAPAEPHPLPSSRMFDLESEALRRRAAAAVALTQPTPQTPWPVAYIPAGTASNGQQLFMAVPFGTLPRAGLSPTTHLTPNPVAPPASPNCAESVPPLEEPVFEEIQLATANAAERGKG